MSLSIHCVLLLLLFGVCLNVGAGALNEPLKPLPAVPSLDPLRVEIGRRLFNDSQLSVTGTVSCASCHQLAKGGADTQAFSIGATGLAARKARRRSLKKACTAPEKWAVTGRM
jgi:cytochrome c peroxidase